MNENLEDKILIQNLREGNIGMFDYIFMHYYSGLVAYAMKLGINNEVAEDIVQDFFLKLWIDKKSLIITESLKNYLFTSIRNRCYDYFRHEKVKEKAKEVIFQNTENSTFSDRDYVVENDLRERINSAIDKLPEKCKKAFIMNLYQGMKPAKIAELEGVSVRTIEGHIGKAYKLLREDLKPYLPGFVIAILLS